MIPKLSLIIVNYRSEDALVDCLRSVNVASSESLEVILVDNSVGGGAERVLQASGLRGHYFPQSENIGYTRAANFGAEHSRGEYVCFLNPDTVLNAHALDRLASWLAQHPRTVVGPRELQPDGQIVTTAFPYVTRRYLWGANLAYKAPWPRAWQPWLGWLVPSFEFAWLCRNATEPQPVPVLSGSCLAMSRETWQEVGRWNTDLTYFGLESEWFERARELGVTAWYLPDATMYHEHGVSIRRSSSGTVRQEADANRRWYAQRRGWIAVIGLALVLWLEYRLRPKRR